MEADCEAAASRRALDLLHGAPAVVEVPWRADDVGAGLRAPVDERASQAARAARDHRDLARQVEQLPRLEVHRAQTRCLLSTDQTSGAQSRHGRSTRLPRAVSSPNTA